GIAAFGVGLAEAPRSAHHRVYLGVHLSRAEVEQPAIQAALKRMHATAILDGETVSTADVTALQALVDQHVDVGNGGWGKGRPFRPLRAETDVIASTDAITKTVNGAKVLEFVPGRRFDAFDQIYARRRGQRLVRPDYVIRPASMPKDLRDRGVYVLDGRGSSVRQTHGALALLQQELDRGNLESSPLSDLR
ncbi:MAG: hypothetical protein ABIP21_03735, partial [Acidimicrobiia bacterium]